MVVKERFENTIVYVYDAKKGKLYEYPNVEVRIINEYVRAYVKSPDDIRVLPLKEYEIKCTGACFSFWAKEANRNKAIDIYKDYIKKYAIEKTAEATKQFSNSCKYYRSMIKNVDNLI